ncbi:MAG: META domain-containing protein [Chloroflexi bacterium]|jgi:heat shock protein HslJ|nr:META domain-containing protein [Chloroflexota bacterium]
MRRLLATTLTAALLVGACAAAGGSGGTIEGIRWVATSVATDGTLEALPAGVTADATFADGTVAGFAGCNTFSGPATVDGSKLAIGQLAATMMACVDPAMTVESAYLTALPTATSFTATADKLTLFDKDGKEVLVYEPGPAKPIVGSWTVSGYNDGQQAVVSPIAGTTLTATFAEDGALSGSSGCNTFNGTYTLDGDAITVGALGTTKMACEEPVMAQEQQFLMALASAKTVTVEGGLPVLRTAGDAIAVTFAK